MLNKAVALVLATVLASAAPPAAAAGLASGDTSVREQARVLAGRQAKARVQLVGGATRNGRVLNAGPEGFTLLEKNGTATDFRYEDVSSLRERKFHMGPVILLGALIALGAYVCSGAWLYT